MGKNQGSACEWPALWPLPGSADIRTPGKAQASQRSEAWLQTLRVIVFSFGHLFPPCLTGCAPKRTVAKLRLNGYMKQQASCHSSFVVGCVVGVGGKNPPVQPGIDRHRPLIFCSPGWSRQSYWAGISRFLLTPVEQFWVMNRRKRS